MVKMSKGFKEEYENIQHPTSKAYSTPPVTTPRMISYNLQSETNKPTYSQVTRNSTSTQDEVIYPTFTEIDWQTQMEEIQKETLEKCRKMTQEMIQEAKTTISSELNSKIEQSIVQSNKKFDMMMDMMKEMSQSITKGF